MVEGTDSDKPSSLMCCGIHYRHRKVYSLGPGEHIHNTLFSSYLTNVPKYARVSYYTWRGLPGKNTPAYWAHW